jgi:hypothetical protein
LAFDILLHENSQDSGIYIDTDLRSQSAIKEAINISFAQSYPAQQ